MAGSGVKAVETGPTASASKGQPIIGMVGPIVFREATMTLATRGAQATTKAASDLRRQREYVAPRSHIRMAQHGNSGGDNERRTKKIYPSKTRDNRLRCHCQLKTAPTLRQRRTTEPRLFVYPARRTQRRKLNSGHHEKVRLSWSEDPWNYDTRRQATDFHKRKKEGQLGES